MQLHPLNLTKAENAVPSQPPSPNPLLDTNPFGAVPLSALVQSPAGSMKGKPAGEIAVDQGDFGAALEDSALHTPKSQAQHTHSHEQSPMQASLFQRQAAVPADAFKDLLEQQVSFSSKLPHQIDSEEPSFTEPARLCIDVVYWQVTSLWHTFPRSLCIYVLSGADRRAWLRTLTPQGQL